MIFYRQNILLGNLLKQARKKSFFFNSVFLCYICNFTCKVCSWSWAWAQAQLPNGESSFALLGCLVALQQGLCGLGPQTHQGPPALLAAADSAIARLPLHVDLPLRKLQARGPWFVWEAGASFIWLHSLACKTPSFEQQWKVVFLPRDLF